MLYWREARKCGRSVSVCQREVETYLGSKTCRVCGEKGTRRQRRGTTAGQAGVAKGNQGYAGWLPLKRQQLGSRQGECSKHPLRNEGRCGGR